MEENRWLKKETYFFSFFSRFKDADSDRHVGDENYSNRETPFW